MPAMDMIAVACTILGRCTYRIRMDPHPHQDDVQRVERMH
jgi:hypothetical protein